MTVDYNKINKDLTIQLNNVNTQQEQEWWAGLQGVLWLDRDHKDMEVTTWHNQLSEQKGLGKGGTPTHGGQFGVRTKSRSGLLWLRYTK